ncbi:MAG TPA: TolC family protein [Myxococcales bacterium]|jgi:cobalt-zinc-cadmium efflux system outer membrane protein|nr:TolC family protein [Myxococcales bacterium]
MIAACVALAIAAPPPLRLADLLREAREKNPELKAARARASGAKDAVSPAGTLDDPMLMVQLWNAPVDFSTVPVMIQLTQPIPLGGKRSARADVASSAAAVAAAELSAREREIDAQVAAAYADLFLAEREQEVDDEVENVLKVLLQLSQTRVATARGELLEMLRAQASLVQLRSDREVAIDRRKSAWARLSALVDREQALPAGSTTAPGLVPSLPDVATLQARALRKRPELAGARAQVEGAEAQARLARAAQVPDLSVFVAEMHTFKNPAGVSDFLFAGVQVSLPIFRGSKTGPMISSADSQVVAARESEHGLRNRVAAEVAEAHAHVVSEQRQIDLHHQLIPIARHAVETAQSSYAAGRGEFTMVLDSARELRMHDLELASHLAMYEKRLAELQAAAGSDLGLDESAESGHDERH